MPLAAPVTAAADPLMAVMSVGSGKRWRNLIQPTGFGNRTRQ
jgi:hypothetical protein